MQRKFAKNFVNAFIKEPCLPSEIHTPIDLKEKNIACVKRAILRHESVSKPEVAEITGLSVVTCGSILNELIRKGDIVEEPVRLSNGGRPAVRYHYSEKMGNVLCIFVYEDGGDLFLRYQVMDFSGNILEANSFFEKTLDAYGLAQVVKKICRGSLHVGMVVIGIQGCVNNDIVEFSDISNLCGVKLAEYISEETKIPTYVENDMNTIALGFSKINEGCDAVQNSAFLFFPRSQTPAGGFIVDGHILRGVSNLAGELSFFPFQTKSNGLKSAFSDIRQAEPIIYQLLVSTVIFLDPALIVITGDLSREMDSSRILKMLETRLRRKQLPKIEILPIVEGAYFAGLHDIAIEHLVEQ